MDLLQCDICGLMCTPANVEALGYRCPECGTRFEDVALDDEIENDGMQIEDPDSGDVDSFAERGTD